MKSLEFLNHTEGSKDKELDSTFESLQKERENIKDEAIKNGDLIYDEKGSFLYGKSPNGKKSELNEEQWISVRTDHFKEWFGEWDSPSESSSKIINHVTKEPLVVFHQTNTDFESFDKNKIRVGGGFYFSEGDYTFGTNIMSCYLNIRNPKHDKNVSLITKETLEKLKIEGYDGVYCDTFNFHANRKKYTKIAATVIRSMINKSLNYIGVETFSRSGKIRGKNIKNPDATFLKFLELVALDPNQIKSADKNNGLYDKSKNNIHQ